MTAFSEIFNREVTREQFELYTKILADIPLPQLEEAFVEAAKTLERFPVPAQIRALALRSNGEDDDTQAVQGWNAVLAEIRRCGVYRGQVGAKASEFDEATEHALRQVGGYMRLCNVEIGEDGKDPMPFIRRDFLSAYKHYGETGGAAGLTRGEARAFLDRLAGKELS